MVGFLCIDLALCFVSNKHLCKGRSYLGGVIRRSLYVNTDSMGFKFAAEWCCSMQNSASSSSVELREDNYRCLIA